MRVTVEVVGEDSYDLEVEDATYADLLAEVEFSPHEVSVLVDGRPVPEDQPVETDHVKVLRLVKGGGTAGDAPGVESANADALGVSQPDFELPNAGTGPDPLRLADLAADPDNDALIVLLLSDYRSRSDRRQLRAVADRYGEFRDRDAAVVAVLPEPTGRAETWQEELHVPFALVADAGKSVAGQYGQPTRFGRLGRLHDWLGRLPAAAILDAREALGPYAIHRGDAPDDRPSVDELLGMVDRLLDG